MVSEGGSHRGLQSSIFKVEETDEKIEYTLKMTDSAGNGWNGTLITNEHDLGVFYGSAFTSGNSQTMVISLRKHSENIIVFLEPGQNSSEVGFTIVGPDGELMCKREPGYAAISGEVQCRFCYSCDLRFPTSVTYTY